MKALRFLDEMPYRGFQLPNGKIIDLFPYRYDGKLDLDNNTYLTIDDDEYYKSNLPTITELVKQGVVKEITCIEKQHDIDFSSSKYILTKKDVEKIIAEFKEHGFNVTKESIEHNYNAWKRDYKSGYRDENNNYHLFTPCCCNPLSFRATSLHKQCDDWQTTYTC
jgi:hypothetical protein